MWLKHWSVAYDPFLDPASPFVATPVHEEAMARVAYAIEAGMRLVIVRGGPGLGKSRVLTEVLAESRTPTRRIARVVGPIDGTSLFACLSEALGSRIAMGTSRGDAWRSLADAVRLAHCQRFHVILAVEDGPESLAASDPTDLERLVHLDPRGAGRMTVILTTRGPLEGEGRRQVGLEARLGPLTRGDAEHYLATKLAAAGRSEPTFTPRAFSRLHLASGGNPRDLDRLASLAMMAAALRRLEVIPPEVVERVGQEFAPTRAVA